MNIFIIPSWYPSLSNPIYGTFNKEQAELMAQFRPSWNVGVSTWGQGDPNFLIPVSKPQSLFNLLKSHYASKHQVAENCTEYFAPAFAWTRKWKKGNLKGLIKANEHNLEQFISDYGKPDVISAQASYPAALIAEFLSKKFEIPYIVTIRMSPFPFPEFKLGDQQLKQIIASPLANADRLIATSRSLKERLAGFGLAHVSVVNNPVDISKFLSGPSEKSELVRILAIGRLERQKGIDILLKAVSEIDSPFELRIGGGGSKLDELKSLAGSLGLKEKVKWLGQLAREEVIEEMQHCSFYVLSSRHETFGNVIVEAMSCGKPIVATRCGGPDELVNHAVGYLSEIEVNDLSRKIQLMIQEVDSFDAKKIRKEALEKYAPEVWIGNLESVFRGVAAK